MLGPNAPAGPTPTQLARYVRQQLREKLGFDKGAGVCVARLKIAEGSVANLKRQELNCCKIYVSFQRITFISFPKRGMHAATFACCGLMGIAGASHASENC